MSEPRKILLGVIDTTGGEAIALPADLDNADPETIKAALEAAENAKREETQHLRQKFGVDAKEPP